MEAGTIKKCIHLLWKVCIITLHWKLPHFWIIWKCTTILSYISLILRLAIIQKCIQIRPVHIINKQTHLSLHNNYVIYLFEILEVIKDKKVNMCTFYYIIVNCFVRTMKVKLFDCIVYIWWLNDLCRHRIRFEISQLVFTFNDKFWLICK